ncbi:hypothetical protein JX265_010586 [Neoarthrinium moseri]|uniref:Uncharacterized protein n=1 Tax=Neoarthrinium moseri TaxID=1658444 RepID=A0A9Q0AKA0_9PEZI|nr:hypothetical protein JX265_010586 [Neoarthrinium moseri]
MTSARDSTSRLRQTLNPLLTTSLGGFHNNQLNTPHSAISATSPYVYSAVQTPASSIQPYNPQEWGPSPAVERTHQFPPPQSHDAPQGSPLPPPPYSPPRSQRPASVTVETPPANTSSARASAPMLHRPSPEPQAPQNFPPPPNVGGRGASRERRFGFPSLSRRRDAAESTSPPETHPPISISRPQPLSIQVPHLSERVESSPAIVAPNARRAASTSAIETPTSARSRSASQSRWGPGMPVPPPPPGPPPSNSRSQSLNRTPEPVLSPPTRRPPPGGVTALGPVPPTPADWVEEDHRNTQRPEQQALSIDTASASSSASQPADESTSGSSSAGGQLTRTGAVRGEKSIRERRNESRTRHSRGDSNASVPQLSDIVVPQGSGLTRRFSVHKNTPRSGGRASQDTPWSGQTDLNTDSRNSTPRLSSGMHPETPTPPFSPLPRKSHPITDNGQPLAPKALPTPPPQSRSASSSSVTRPELHNSIGSIVLGHPPSTPMTKQTIVSQTADQFSRGTIERFQIFAQREAAAASDADRVKLFADFIVNESRLRRERYSSAIGAMGSEIFDLTRDLFRPMKPRRDSTNSEMSEWTPQMSENKSNRNSIGSIFGRDSIQQSNSAPASAGVPISPVGGPPNNANWNSGYKPALSPILSMSVSEAPDDRSSRGRPSSRWWEADSAGESSQRLERSKRESKYMGVPKEAREALQWSDPPTSAEAYASSSKGYGPDEYPPEKQGWHETEQSGTPQPFRRSLLSLPASTSNTPSPLHLDVSRLVTLPPPYPRHHPAVNNNHPELTEIRALVRTLSDMKELQDMKELATKESRQKRDEAAKASSQRRQTLRINLQREVSAGTMSYADAAAIEADSADSERAQSKDLEKQDFDRFQNSVVMPSNEILTGRIGQATSLFDDLRSRLFVETHTSDPNMPQEEGDEKPELLEKLTLLKWIFEARETLHREIFDLLSDRNDRYKEMVILPYKLTGNEEKISSAQAFFAEDAEKRRVAFANEVLHRTREFRSVVEENVARGIDMQLNAFWDIAPPLKSLLDKVPQSLEDFRIQIPPVEYEENPSYHEHPLQYLFSLLLHAEKSTYQFIESQTNLFCLLHEVKEAVMMARMKVSEAEGQDSRSLEEQRKAEQKRLTDDLKEKVRVVRGQWDEGLGDGVRGVKERVGEWLLSTGGWDENLEDVGPTS